jgi:hypothetical protein
MLLPNAKDGRCLVHHPSSCTIGNDSCVELMQIYVITNVGLGIGFIPLPLLMFLTTPFHISVIPFLTELSKFGLTMCASFERIRDPRSRAL